MNSIKRCLPAVAVAAFALAGANAAWAQIGAPVTPGGVSVDGDGVLQSGATTADPRLAELWKNAAHMKKDDQLLYISLPRLFEEAKKCIEAGKPLPNELRYLGGMTRLQYVFVYPAEKDLVIAGPAEPFDADVPFRPLGKLTGRPVLQLDDLVTALRACGPGKAGTLMGCDLQITQEIADRIRKKTDELAPKLDSIGDKKAAQLIAEAGGNQPVKFFGVDTNTRYAFVCIEADYRLKQLGLGILDTPVKKVKSYNHLATKPEPPHRFVLESNLDHLVVSPDENAFELRGAALKVNSTLMGVQGPEAEKISDAAKQFIASASANVDELSKHIVAWADLANLNDLAVLAALIGEDGLQKKIEWDLSWLTDAKGYAVAAVVTPKTAKTLTVCRHNGAYSIFTSGGVLFDPVASVKKRSKDEKDTIKTKSSRPTGADWSTAQKPGVPTEDPKK